MWPSSGGPKALVQIDMQEITAFCSLVPFIRVHSLSLFITVFKSVFKSDCCQAKTLKNECLVVCESVTYKLEAAADGGLDV